MTKLTYEKNGTIVTLNKELAQKISNLVSCGLVEGVGSPEPGQMCVEAAVNFACGFEHGDDPICVGAAVRSFKIRLNDSNWSSNIARGEGMRKIAIAQLGSDTLNQVEFSSRLALKTINELLPVLLEEIGLPEHAKSCREAKDLEAALYAASDAASDAASAASDAASAARYAANAASTARYAANAASTASDARAARYAASAASDAASAASDAASAASAARYADDKYLILAANICLEVLTDMNCPGVALLNEL